MSKNPRYLEEPPEDYWGDECEPKCEECGKRPCECEPDPMMFDSMCYIRGLEKAEDAYLNHLQGRGEV